MKKIVFFTLMSFLTLHLYSTNNTDIFLGKYDLNGNLSWGYNFGSSGMDDAYCIAIDNSGNILFST